MTSQLLKLLIVTQLYGDTADDIVTSLPVEEKRGSKVHKPLAEILGIKKTSGPVEQTKVAVVIDPKIAKVLRPHQIEGVKVPSLFIISF